MVIKSSKSHVEHARLLDDVVRRFQLSSLALLFDAKEMMSKVKNLNWTLILDHVKRTAPLSQV